MGNPTDPPEDWVIDKLCEAARDSRNHRYSAATGIYNLRREVANRYESRFGVSLDPDQEVVATIGSKEGFSHMCLALLGPGDTALVPAPSFPIHIHAVALASANVISLDVRDGSSFLANIARTCESLYPRPKILVINYPHNPTATVVDRPFFEEIVALAKKYRFFVIHDFAYGDIGFDGYQPPSFLSVKGAKSVGCEFTTMSKGYNMAGWRVGFAAGNRDMLGALEGDQGLLRLRDLPGRPGRGDRGSAAWREPAGWPRSPSIRRGATRWFAASSAWAGHPQLPKAGMFVWTAIPEPWRSQSGSIDFAMKLLENANVAVSPGRGFGETGEGFLRLALVENEQRLRQAVRQVARYLRPEKAAR